MRVRIVDLTEPISQVIAAWPSAGVLCFEGVGTNQQHIRRHDAGGFSDGMAETGVSARDFAVFALHWLIDQLAASNGDWLLDRHANPRLP